MYCDLFSFNFRHFLRECTIITPPWELTAPFKLKFKLLSKRILKVINNKAIKQIVFRAPRESHRKVFLEEEEEQ